MTLLTRGGEARRSWTPPAAGHRAHTPVVTVVTVATSASVAITVMVLALLLAGGAPSPAVTGLQDAGVITGWGLPLLRLALYIAAVGTVGLLCTGAVLITTGTVELEDIAASTIRAASSWSAAWCACALGVLLLTISEIIGAPVWELPLEVLAQHATTSRGQALLLVAALVAMVSAGAACARSPRAARWLLVVATCGLVPMTLNGHAASAADHDLATTALLVHVAAATIWLGGLFAMLLVGHRHPQVLASAVSRFSVIALAAFLAIALSGAVGAWSRLGTSYDAWTSSYGALVATKVALLGLLGAAGWHHRRRLVPGLQAGRSRAFLLFAGGELAVMGAAAGLAVALSRTPTPVVAATTVQPEHGAGHETLATTVEPFTVSRLLVEWRPDALVLTLVGLALITYLTGVRSMHAAGECWSRWRTGAFTSGGLLVVWALCGGLSTYAPAMVSAQVGQFVVMLVGAPALLVLGAPLSLWLRVRRVLPGRVEAGDLVAPAVLHGRTARVLADPTTGLLLVTVLVFVVYRTAFIEASLRSFWLHLLVNVLALLVGMVLLWPVLGADPVPYGRGPAERLVPLLAVAVSLALLAAQLRYGDQLLAGQWFLELRWRWIDPVEDQRRAGALAAGAVALLVPLLALALRTAPRGVPTST